MRRSYASRRRRGREHRQAAARKQQAAGVVQLTMMTLITTDEKPHSIAARTPAPRLDQRIGLDPSAGASEALRASMT
jgi:hypothetical protein